MKIKMTGFAVALAVAALLIAYCADATEFSDHQKLKILRRLKQLNKPAIKSIKSEDGDIIDCVHITKQPAFDHPSLKNHIIQMKPSFSPERESKYTKKEQKSLSQVWHINGDLCPVNTVPIRRTKKEDLLRPKMMESFGKKTHKSIPAVTAFDTKLVHQYAIMGARNDKFYGTEVAINLWKPFVQIRDEFSLAQTWLVAGNGSNLNTIEAGWQVYPELYNDYNPRLFVYWTRDGYEETGCYNLLCSGFVQTSNEYTVGGSFTNVSRYRGIQYELSLLIFKDRETGNWWLTVNDKDLIGYWPNSLFTSLKNEATIVEWGGEIINTKSDNGKHTTTDMGSGHFADEGYKKASFFRNILTVDGSNTLIEPKIGLYYFADNHNCYNVKTGEAETTWGLHFFYGGPGRNVKCS